MITALSAVASWAVGDATLAELVTKAPVIFGGLGLAALGVKVNDMVASNAAGEIRKGQIRRRDPAAFMRRSCALP